MSDELQPRGRPSDTHKRQLLEVRDDAGRTPLQRACENGHEPAVRALLQGGASASATERSSGWSALMLAAAGGHEEVVRTLLRLAGSEQDARLVAPLRPLPPPVDTVPVDSLRGPVLEHLLEPPESSMLKVKNAASLARL